MINPSPTLRRLAGLGTAAVATVAIAAPVAAADPPTIPSPVSQAVSPRLGEHLSGRDRIWLTGIGQRPALRLGEQLSGGDRSWLAAGASDTRVAPSPSNGSFDWGDAGIGAGTAVFAVLLAGGGVLVIQKRASLAH